MIFNMKDDPTLKEDIDKLNSEVSQHKDEITNLRFNQSNNHADILMLSKELNNYEMLLADLSTQLNDVNRRVTSLESNMHKWTSVGAVTDVGTYGLNIDLSDFKEMMLLLIYNNSIIGSGIYDMSAFDTHPITINAPIDSTFKQRLVSMVKKSDTAIMVEEVKNLTGVNIYVR